MKASPILRLATVFLMAGLCVAGRSQSTRGEKRWKVQ